MKKGNKIILGTVFLLTILSFLGSLLYKNHMEKRDVHAVIERNGHILREIDLKNASSEEWDVENGTQRSVIQIEPGKIRFKEANCPHQQCVKTGWISTPGETAVCLPFKLSITITGQSNGPDAVSQ
ncbi:MAG: NusG domain II-containing protein [Aminobacterium sp.]|jgi:hypothetical protein|uniref:NusG domain II-containing protein n=1 Tax=unclassified Aminobacterium TaxID=2685012 RepID=UPI001BCE2A7D|nr:MULTISPECIES: NusG domain II-containing protein [unclassified Aminobacterium]MDD2207501.1 NusG domain II-containing protein [Aminobacterium sp.]MDD3426467.1 NusG domain II-containing protein [Aminobacterium sp.]MDD3708269.1 NusG domain II-containing protein [Aminobacterium sp.]MDD4229479.1 NusG domain II-containing protein [Aminobacterium sp.]MDD4552332.1 NusG domain II-containing protein [Aminobacterium sp.]